MKTETLRGGRRWIFFAEDHDWRRQLRLRFVAGDARIEANFRLKLGAFPNVTASGELLGSAYEWQAESRREVGGGARSYAPRFVGTFIHDGGTSGEFHVRHKDSELLTLGVLGAPHSVSGFKTDPASVDCAVEVTGIPDLSLRLEHAFMYSPALLDEADIRAAGDRRFYVGHCFDHGADFAVTHPPAIAVLTALLLADTLLLREYYLRQAD